ncbi:MAG: toprim domain-containing protein [Deltaproteobacteria bacterium]|nr:toprim domain-containing protein [Deltaproteobacteria bacterium]
MNKPALNPSEGIKQAFPEKDKPKVILAPERALKANERLKGDPSALAYVTDARKISMTAIDHFKIGIEISKDSERWLTIPHFSGGNLKNIKSRSIPPQEKTFRRIPGCPSILFNQDVLREKPSMVYLCEGELDSISLWDQGEKNVIAVTAGAGSLQPEWIDQLKDIDKIILCYDPDEPGQKGAREAARRLGYDRCFNVILPDGQDVNEYFNAGHDIAAFYRIVAEARRFDVQGVSSFTDCLKQLEKDHQSSEQTRGLLTGLPSLDRLNQRGMKPGELWVIAAPPGVGKSSLALQITTHQAFTGTPSLFFSLEMNIGAVTEKIVQAYTGVENIGICKIQKTRDAYLEKPLYLGRAVVKPTIDGIIEILREAVKRYGLKLVAFDHLHFLCRSITNQVQEIGLAVQAFKLLAEEMEIPVILIAQPRKVDLTKAMTAEDLKDSSSIHSDADGIIILHRNRKASTEGNDGGNLAEQSLDPVTLVRFEKARYGRGGECLLYFHGEFSRFDELTK